MGSLEVTPGPGESCSFVLAPTPQTVGNPRDGVVLIHNELLPGLGPRGVSVVAAARLSDPSAYGREFTGYAALITVNGDQVGYLPMARAGDDLWSVAFSDASLLSAREVTVQVDPFPGPPDHAVLTGTGSCPGACVVNLYPADGAPLGSGGAAWVRPLDGGGFTVAVVAANLLEGPGYQGVLRVFGEAPFATFPLVAVGGAQAATLYAGAYTSSLVNIIPEIDLLVVSQGEGAVVLRGTLESCD